MIVSVKKSGCMEKAVQIDQRVPLVLSKREAEH